MIRSKAVVSQVKEIRNLTVISPLRENVSSAAIPTQKGIAPSKEMEAVVTMEIWLEMLCLSRATMKNSSASHASVTRNKWRQ